MDRERQDEHELHVQACDNGQPILCTTALVIVSVEDLNDNAPLFFTIPNDFEVPADKIGYLGRIITTDLDSDGPNSDIIYELVGNLDSRLQIDNYGHLYTSEGLKVDTNIQLKVKATDQGIPSLSSETVVKLKPLGKFLKKNYFLNSCRKTNETQKSEKEEQKKIGKQGLKPNILIFLYFKRIKTQIKK